MPPNLERPVFVVGAPFAGADALTQSLSRAAGVWHTRATFLPDAPGGSAAGHRLDPSDAGAVGAQARNSLLTLLRDRSGRTVDGAAGPLRAVVAGMRLAMSVPFLMSLFSDARFVLVVREPSASITEMVEAWRGGHAVSVPALDGWEGPAWSLPLIPGWRTLAGRPLQEIVVEQWRAISELVLDDLESLPPERWGVAEREALVGDPRGELRRLCSLLDIEYDQALLTPLEDLSRVNAPGPPADLTPALLDRTNTTVERVRALVAPRPQPGPRPDTPLASSFSPPFAERLAALGSSLLVSTYQTGKVIIARERNGTLNTHFRDFDRPMGIAIARDRIAIGAGAAVWDLRNMPAVAAKLEPAGVHDACYLPRNVHFTGDILVHDLAFAQGQLWLAATAFSCLATLDADHSFVPRWKPGFISQIALGDRCHLNGIAVVDDQVRYVTVLGRSDEPRGWVPHKATGGLILEVPSSETVASGLSMPHSPRWHEGSLWVLQSGRGELCRVDVDTGTVDVIAKLPGFTRGLALADHTAFVGLSQIRESAVFGDLPLVEQLKERMCGVWMVDIRSGAVEGFLRFEDLVQEIFDVVLLAGQRYPEIAEPVSGVVRQSFELP